MKRPPDTPWDGQQHGYREKEFLGGDDMRLSEAIATGRILLKSHAGQLQTMDGQRGCALGMALHAIGSIAFGPFGFDFADVHREWPWLKNEVSGICECPFWQKRFDIEAGLYSQAVAHLFDNHVMRFEPSSSELGKQWTLDQLIDWVRSVEPADQVPEALAMNDETLRGVQA